jgi:hypothetical protein
VSGTRCWLKEMNDPQDVLEQFLTHLKDQAWTEAASLFSEPAISSTTRGWRGAASSTGGPPRDWGKIFLGFTSDDEVLSADGPALVAGFLARQDQRNQLRLSLENEDAFTPDLMAVLSSRIGPFLTPRMIGTVFDGPEEAFVVCRVGEGSVDEFDGSERLFPGQAKTFPLRREKDGWRLVDILGSVLNPGFGIAYSEENPKPGEELWAGSTKPNQG